VVLRVATKGWNAAADVKIDEGVRSGELMAHGGNDIVYRMNIGERRELAMRAIFLLNITKV